MHACIDSIQMMFWNIHLCIIEYLAYVGTHMNAHVCRGTCVQYMYVHVHMCVETRGQLQDAMIIQQMSHYSDSHPV